MKKTFFALLFFLFSCVSFAQDSGYKIRYPLWILNANFNLKSGTDTNQVISGEDTLKFFMDESGYFHFVSKYPVMFARGVQADTVYMDYFLIDSLKQSNDSMLLTIDVNGRPHWIHKDSVGGSAENPGYWIKEGDNIYYNSGNVGIGATAPVELLNISGTSPGLKIEEPANSSFSVFKKYKNSGFNMFNLLIDPNSTFSIYQNSSSTFQPTLMQSATMSADALFHVSSMFGTKVQKLSIGSTGASGMIGINYTVTNESNKLVTSSAVYNYLQWTRVTSPYNYIFPKNYTDNVGIGTNSEPQHRLSVEGDFYVNGSHFIAGGSGDADETGYINGNDAFTMTDAIWDDIDDYNYRDYMVMDVSGNGLINTVDMFLVMQIFAGYVDADSAHVLGKVLDSREGAWVCLDEDYADIDDAAQRFFIPVWLNSVKYSFTLPDLTEDNSSSTFLVLDSDDSLKYKTVKHWNYTGNNLYYSSGNIGIGTTTIPDKLTVNGQINVTEGLQLPGGYINLTSLRTFYAGEETGTLGSGNTYISYQAGKNKTGNYNNVSGWQAFNGPQAGGNENNIHGPGAAQKLTGSDNDISGPFAASQATNVNYSVVSGYHALDSADNAQGTSIGSYSSQSVRDLIISDVFGTGAAQYSDSIVASLFSGPYAGRFAKKTYASTYTGPQSGENLSGEYNTSNGYGNMRGVLNVSDADYNTNSGAFGFAGLRFGLYNAGSGYMNGYKLRDASYCFYGGAFSGYNNQDGNYNVFVGPYSGYFETGSYKLYVDCSNTSTPLIWGDFQNDLIEFNGQQRTFKGYRISIDSSQVTDGNFISYSVTSKYHIQARTNNGDIEISSFSNGTDGQEILISKFTDAGTLTIKNAASVAGQTIRTQSGSDLVLTSYAAKKFVCSGSTWFEMD